MTVQGNRKAGDGDILQAPASEADLTAERFVRGVALALRAQWEGEDHFAVAATHAAASGDEDMAGDLASDPADGWSDYRAESEAVILTYLEMLRSQGFRIVRDLS